MEIINNNKLSSEIKKKPKLIAFYLPQYHPIPENNLWWGKGFTEWTNVTKAKPLFEGHYQPHLPGDFGFYDLRVRETRREQIKVAKDYGIDGFCYHYYWFSGKRLLNQPIDDMLTDTESDMPFCLCWANENWTRRWDAADEEILIKQNYVPENDLNFIKSLMPYFMDERYIKIDGRLFLVVYRPQAIPNVRNVVRDWRDYCRSIGLGEIHLCAALTHGNESYVKFGFDSGVEFPPHNLREQGNINHLISFFNKFKGSVLQYAAIAQDYLGRSYPEVNVFKTVFPSWDNTARTNDRAVVVLNGTPDNYEYWLSETINSVKQSNVKDQIIFINAWNEWAEGCHLEPDRKFSNGFLLATLNATQGMRRFKSFSHTELPCSNETRRFWKDIKDVIKYHFYLKIGKIKLFINRRPWLRRIVLSTVRISRNIFSKITK